MKPVDLAVTVNQPAQQAQDRILDRVGPGLRALGFTEHAQPGVAEYRPRFIGLVIVWAVRRLRGEHLTLTFEQRGRATEVRAAGRLRNRDHAEFTDMLTSS
jgi:hypothetical protein